MKSLIVEDEPTSRFMLQQLLEPFGAVFLAEKGTEAIGAFVVAREKREPFDLICLDIMLPEMDGQEVLRMIRSLEERDGILKGDGVKVLMTTVLDDKDHIFSSFREFCDGYLVKPFQKAKLIEHLRNFELIDGKHQTP
jgi:two-component system, chemotaxis family, chemotaxis protein CheY